MSTIPTISVIIPNFNQARYLGEAIRSALNQTYRSMEIIVVDDGSTDNSREVAAQFGNQIRYLWQENQGLAGARNTGINASNGGLIGLLDADDQWLPNFLETMVSLADKSSDAAVYYCRAQGMDADGSELPQVFGGPVGRPGTTYLPLLRSNFLIPSTIVMRRSIVRAAGLFDPKLRSCEDWDLWLRLLPRHLFVGTWKCLARYRLHGSSLSADSSVMQKAAKAVIEKHFGPDDGQWHTWSDEKRRAFGGVYRYHLLTSLQRQNDWQAGAVHLRRALQVDPTLSADLSLFYELALGSQPLGHRGTAYQLDTQGNASRVRTLLTAAFDLALAPALQPLFRRTLGTADYALGLVAYNTGHRSLSRRFFLSALCYRPELCCDTLMMGDLIKSFISPLWLNRMKLSWDRAGILRGAAR